MMCNFCGSFCCQNCMPIRKRPHPLSKDGSGKRYNACVRCDTKYLNLQLGHVINKLNKELRIEQKFTVTGYSEDILIVIKTNKLMSRVSRTIKEIKTNI